MMRLVCAALLLLAACSEPAAPLSVGGGERRVIAPSDLAALFDCLRANGQTLVAAHRGGPMPGYAENAIPTFENTLAQAPVLLEIDIAQTSDGQLVLMHDETVDRTTNGAGEVSALSLAEIQALTLEDENGAALDTHPPALRDVLHWAAGKTVLELDIKRGVAYEDAIAEVRAARAMNRVIFITYNIEGAARLNRLAPEAVISVPVESARDLDTLERRGVELTQVLAWTGIEEPNSALNAALAERGVETLFGTLGGEDSWDTRFARDGDQYAAFADTGLALIATDRAAEAVRDLDAHDGADAYAALQCAAS